MTELLTGTVTFLFTDVEGSTQLLRRVRGAYGQVLAEHQGVLREVFRRHGGEEVDTQGDSFFVAFRHASDAVLAAVEAQRSLLEHDWPEGVELRVRIGVHTGNAAVEHGRYVGLAVHRAARICAAGHGGQVLLSQTTVNLLEDEEEELPGVEMRALGPQRLKDFDRPVTVYQAVAAGLPDEFPPLRTLDAPAPERGMTPLVRADAEAQRETAGVLARMRRQPRGRLVVAILAAIAAVAALGAVLALRGESEADAGISLDAVRPGSLIRVDPETNTIVDVIPSIGTIGGLPIVVDRTAWLVTEDETVVRVNLDTRRITTRGFHDPCGLAVEPTGDAWIGSGCEERTRRPGLLHWDARAGLVDRTIALPGPPFDMVLEKSTLWVTVGGAQRGSPGKLLRIDTRTDRVAASYAVGAEPFNVVFAPGAAWVANYDHNTITKLLLPEGVSKTIPTGTGPTDIAFGSGSIWVVHYWDGTVTRLSPENDLAEATLDLGRTGTGAVAATDDAVWVGGDGRLLRIDPRENRVVKRFVSERLTFGPTVTPDGLWVAVGGG